MTVVDYQSARAGQSTPHISILIPVFNEREVLPHCLGTLLEVLEPLRMTYELLFVDDGSHDGSANWLLEKKYNIPEIQVLQLTRNFGKEAALTAGLDHVRGEVTIILDADLQDPPALIPEMLRHWQQGYDVVLMQRRNRQGESWLKRSSARAFYGLLNRLSNVDIPANVGDFRLMSRAAVTAVCRLPERNRYMKGLMSWVGMPTMTLQYDRHARRAGHSKWGYLKLCKLAWEAITSFSTRPLMFASLLGLTSALFGGAFGLWICFKALVIGDSVQGYPSLIAILTFLGGTQLFTIGILGEYVGKIYMETKQRPVYLLNNTSRTPIELSVAQNHAQQNSTASV